MPLLRLTHDTRQWTVFCWPHLLLRCELPGKLTHKSLVIHPLFAWQQGPLTFILSLALQLALIVLSSCRFSTTIGFRAFAMGSPLRVESAVRHTLSIGTKTLSEPWYKILRDEVTLWVECGPRYTLDPNEGLLLRLFSKFLQDGVTLLGSNCLQFDHD